MIVLEAHLPQNLDMGKKEETQSIAVSEEEKLLIAVLASAHGIKPATAARQLLFRGISGYLKDRSLQASELDTEIYAELVRLVDTDQRLSRIREVVKGEIAKKERKKNSQAPASRRRGHTVTAKVGSEKID